MATGRIKWYSPIKGYGFIVPDSGAEDLFFHYSGLSDPEFRSFNKGDAVTFEDAEGEKGPKATNVHLVAP